jgi:hypothetical protein
VISARPPPTGFQSPSEYHRACSPDLTVQVRPLSWGSLPFGACRTSGAHSTRACLTRYVAPSGFRSLLAPCFSGRLPALFHAGNAHGVSRPSELFPQLQPQALSGLPCPPAVHRRDSARLQGLLSGVWVRCPGDPYFRYRRDPMLSWASAPPGSSPLPRWLPLRVASSLGLHPGLLGEPSNPGLPSRVSFAGESALGSLEPANPPGVSCLIVPVRFPGRLTRSSPLTLQ